MKHLWRALLVVLVLGAFMPSRSTAQGISTQTAEDKAPGCSWDRTIRTQSIKTHEFVRHWGCARMHGLRTSTPCKSADL